MFYIASLFLLTFSREATPLLPISMSAMIHPIILGKTLFTLSHFRSYFDMTEITMTNTISVIFTTLQGD